MSQLCDMKPFKGAGNLHNKTRLALLLASIALGLLITLVFPLYRNGSPEHAGYNLMLNTSFVIGVIIIIRSWLILAPILLLVMNWNSTLNEMTIAQLLQNISTNTNLIAVLYWAIAFIAGIALGYHIRFSNQSRRVEQQQE